MGCFVWEMIDRGKGSGVRGPKSGVNGQGSLVVGHWSWVGWKLHWCIARARPEVAPRVCQVIPAQPGSNYRTSRSASSSGRLRFAVVLDAPISSKSRCSKTTPNLRLLSDTPCHMAFGVTFGVTLASRWASRFPASPHQTFPTQRIRGFLLPGRVADSGVCRVCRRSWRLFRRIVYLTVDV